MERQFYINWSALVEEAKVILLSLRDIGRQARRTPFGVNFPGEF